MDRDNGRHRGCGVDSAATNSRNRRRGHSAGMQHGRDSFRQGGATPARARPRVEADIEHTTTAPRAPARRQLLVHMEKHDVLWNRDSHELCPAR
ncbi:hypothetical protein [Lysobacter gummosus]|uniref:hypothetical protein n=1 Tax=Lysobacter gummosus TaxID=262324 RepID=UPI00362710B3